MFLIPVIGFGLLRVQPIGDPGDAVRLLLTVLAMVAGLTVISVIEENDKVDTQSIERAAGP